MEPIFVVLLLAVPAVAAIIAAAMGPSRRPVIRWLCLGATLVDLILAGVLAAKFAERRAVSPPPATTTTFRPEFVPGDAFPPGDAKETHATTWDILRFGNRPAATATAAIANSAVTAITVVNGGTNYTSPPKVSFRGGGGSGAEAKVILSLGKVDKIVVVSGGSGYTSTPTVVVEPPYFGAIQFYLGIDGLNVWLVLLTAVLMVPSVLISWNVIHERANEYYAWLLALGTGLLGVFLSFDIILFYVFFELTLVPLFFLIGIWGGPDRRHAARKFFIYTLAGSLITFLGLLAIIAVCYLKGGFSGGQHLTFSIPELVTQMQSNLLSDTDRKFWTAFQMWVFLALITGFAIKVPLVPLHTWLPLAHVEAPTAGSVLLAGVLLKMGTYGFLRFCLPLTPDASITIGVPLIGTLAVIGIIYGAFCALAQTDIKKLVAYSSVSHLGFCMLGMFALNSAGLAGSLLQMINHGLSTGALFLLVGMLYERYHTRQLADYGGMGTRLGLLSFCMVFIALSSVGLPGLNGFVGEALIFFGMFNVHPAFAVLGTAGIVLGAWYLLTMVKGVFFGELKEPHHEGVVGDMDVREICTVAPIMGLCLILGLWPQPVLDAAQWELDLVVNIIEVARTRLDAGPS